MNGRYFLDTNIFVYSFEETSTVKARRAASLIREAVSTRKGIVSYQVVQEFFSVALRRFAKPMSTTDAEQYMSTVLRPVWTVHPSEVLFRSALRICGEHRSSWYDSLIVAAAIEGQCEILYSEDMQHGRNFGSVQIVNPFR